MKVKLNIPDSLNELTLGQYQRYIKAIENTEDRKVQDIKMIEIFCETTSAVAMNMKLADIDSIVKHLIDILNTKQDLVQKFTLDGVEFGFIPNMSDMTYGEYYDLDEFIHDWENMHMAMNVLYRPIKSHYGEKYSIDKYNINSYEKMKEMPLDAVFGAHVFFYSLGKELSETILNYLEKEQEENLLKYLNSLPNGDGLVHSTHSLREMLQSLKISLN
jgi:hypothetical protein